MSLNMDVEADESAVETDEQEQELLEGEPEAEVETEEVDTEAEQEPEGEPEPTKPVGVSTKDGKGVLPFAVLKGARAETRREREARLQVEAERDALKEQLEALKSGNKEPDPLDELAEDFPAAKALVEEVRNLRVQVQAKAAPAKQVDPDDDPIQEAIDSVPMLAGWQAADPEKWARATALDNALRGSPKWASQPLEARFAHVAKLVADEFDIQADDTPSPVKPGKARQDPDLIVKEAPRATPNTLSDFKSGGAKTPDNARRLSAAQQLDRIEQMSDADFKEWQARQG